MIPFRERAEQMGLIADEDRGLYTYSDKHGHIIYRSVITIDNWGSKGHPTDGFLLPHLALFTAAPDADIQELESFQYCGKVSQIYKFVGNEILNDRIKESISSVGMPIIRENTILSYDRCTMRNEILIQNGQNIAQVGDVLPVMIVNNSYDGTRAASIAFAISMDYTGRNIVFAFKLGELRMVHVESSRTTMTSAVGAYMGAFTENIVDLITENFNNEVTEDQMLGLLDVVENIGKKRRDQISELIDEMQEEGKPATSWQIFLAIVRYSSLEPNLNVRKLLESAAESVLVIPARMYNVLSRLGSGGED